MLQITPVILCSDSDKNLWPLSRPSFPKQFLCLLGKESLFQQTTNRLLALSNSSTFVAPPLIVSREEHRFLILEQLREISIENASVLLEPVSRNTTPSLTLAALAATESGNDPVLVVCPSDQALEDTKLFSNAIQLAIKEASAGSITVFGVKPKITESGYSYIKTSPSSDANDKEIPIVECFVHNSDFTQALGYLSEENYFCNTGIFVLKASTWLAALKVFRLSVLEAVNLSWSKRKIDLQFVRPDQIEFAACSAESLDCTLMQFMPTNEFPIKMVNLKANWSDLGTWDAVWKMSPKDDHGNAHLGDIVSFGCWNSLVHASSRLVCTVGLNNLVVIETPDAVLVVDKSNTQNVVGVVNELVKKKRKEHALHRKVYRPWGWYDSVDECRYSKVKRIHVKPGASLSLQKHYHRAEHWIVVKGTAEITNGEKLITLMENQSAFIPIGQVHRLSNPKSTPLEIIEVQLGSYLGEDDILRIEDNYGRIETQKDY
jgi:mannose-1-phosphate guanylyltransferase/mannose-6-phosphate isomerase